MIRSGYVSTRPFQVEPGVIPTNDTDIGVTISYAYLSENYSLIIVSQFLYFLSSSIFVIVQLDTQNNVTIPKSNSNSRVIYYVIIFLSLVIFFCCEMGRERKKKSYKVLCEHTCECQIKRYHCDLQHSIEYIMNPRWEKFLPVRI